MDYKTDRPVDRPTNKMVNKSERLIYTVKDIQQLLNISAKSAYRLMRQTDFPTIKVGGKYMVSKTAFHRWLDQQ